MSAIENLEDAVKAELSKPDTRKAIEGLENVVLEAVKGVLETALPSWLRPFIGGLIDALAEKGITKIEHLTDAALAGLGAITVQAKLGTATMGLTLAPSDLPLTHSDTTADWPGPPQE